MVLIRENPTQVHRASIKEKSKKNGSIKEETKTREGRRKSKSDTNKKIKIHYSKTKNGKNRKEIKRDEIERKKDRTTSNMKRQISTIRR